MAAVGWKGKGAGCAQAKCLPSNLIQWERGEGLVLNLTGLTYIPQDKNKPEAKNEIT